MLNGCRMFMVNSLRLAVAAISIPVNDVSQPPAILVKLPLQLTFLVDNELRSWEKSAVTLAFVFIIQIDFTGSQIETLCLGTPITLAESNLAAGNKTDDLARRRQDLPDEAKFVPKRAGDLYPAYASHLLKSIHQSVVLTLLERLYQNVSILGTRELVNNDFHAEGSSHLSAGAKSRGVDGFGAPPLPKARDASDHKQTDQKRDPIHEVQ